jgi:PelA/Pel-15E family pectate lyase
MRRYICFFLFLLPFLCWAQPDKKEKIVYQTMKKATKFVVDNLSNHGGYVWFYSPDLSRRWGELEAQKSMIWMELGTPAMGHIFLDAYHATGDEFYYRAAESAASALVWAQMECGGWAYMADFAGETSLKHWYETVRKGYENCAQEHLHYYGNATFDDGTIDAAEFLLRIYQEKYDPKYKPALEKTVDFLLKSQYSIGGWPQRWPLHYEFVKNGKEDYSSFITINDGVLTNNIDFLVRCYQCLGMNRVLEPIVRAMSCVMFLQGGKPQAGWAMQHKLDLNFSPGHARDFEPAGYAPTATAEMIQNLMKFYRMTGDSKYLSRIPDALDFLESVKYSDDEVKFFNRKLGKGDILCPTFVEVGTNKALYLHRNGNKYWVDYDPNNLITHYSSVRNIPIQKLRTEYEALLKESKEEATKDSPLLNNIRNNENVRLPKYYGFYFGHKAIHDPNKEQVDGIISKLVDRDYWAAPLSGVAAENPGFSDAPLPKESISIWEYMSNMTTLINYLQNKK